METYGILLSLIPFLMWGVGDYLSSISAKDISPRVSNFVFQLAGLPISLCIALALGFPEITFKAFIVYLLAGLFFSFGFILMMKGFTKGAVGIVSPIANSYSLITLILAVTVFGASFTGPQVISMLVIISGIILVSYEREQAEKKTKKLSSAVTYGLLSMLGFGLGFAIVETIEGYTWYQNMVLLHIAVVIIAFADMIIAKRGKALSEMKKALKYKIALIGGVLGTVGTLGFFGAFEVLGSVVIPAVIASASPLVTSFIAHKREHEKLILAQRAGGLMVVAGVVLLNVV